MSVIPSSYSAQVLGRMRLGLETLKSTKLGKIIVRLTKDSNPGEFNFFPTSCVNVHHHMSDPSNTSACPFECHRLRSQNNTYVCYHSSRLHSLNKYKAHVYDNLLNYATATRDLATQLEKKWREVVSSGDAPVKREAGECGSIQVSAWDYLINDML